MKTIAALLALAAAGLASGCMPPPPKRADALSVISGQGRNRDLKKAKLALLFSETSRNTSAYMRKAAPLARVSDTAFFQSFNGVFQQAFGAVSTVDSLEQARAEGAQLIAVVDIYAQIGSISFTQSAVEVAAIFQTLAGEPISTVRARSSYRVPYPAFTNRWDEASQGALDAFAVALSTNAELAAFAAKLAQSAPAAAATPSAAPAPAPVPSYRSDVEAPGYRLPEDASKFALVVGVERYQALPPADHAARDAKAVKAHLLAAGYPERNIVFLTDAQAGKSGLEKYLDAWLPKNTDERSTVLFYFSGHGAPEPAKGDAYLMPWDGDAKFVESTGYPVKRLYERLAALKARRVLVAMDACFSGAGGRSVIAKGLRPLVAKVDTGASGRVASLTASAGDEVTGTDEAAGHGLFTYHLLKGLSAKGGRATFKDLYEYLSPKVRDAARRDNRDQTPQLSGASSTPL